MSTLQRNTSRRKSGKEIHRFSYSLTGFDKDLEIPVHLTDGESGFVFEAKVSHPTLGNFAWAEKDLDTLYERIDESLHAAADDVLAVDWKPALHIQASDLYCPTSDDPIENPGGISFQLKVQKVRVDKATAHSNSGRRRVMDKDHRVFPVNEGHPEDPDRAQPGTVVVKGQRIRISDEQTTTVLPVKGSEIEAMRTTMRYLDRLSRAMALTFSSEALSRDGIPSPQTLARIATKLAEQ